MKILFLTPQMPYPPQKGTALRNWGLISGLAERHEIEVLSLLEPGQDARPEPPLASACTRVETYPQPQRTSLERLRDMLTTGRPDMALRLESDTYAWRLADWLRRDSFDIVQVEGLELSPYLDVIERVWPNREQAGRPRVVFDDHNCEYLLQQRTFNTDLRTPSRWWAALYSFIQWRRLQHYEAQVCRRADHVMAVSDADAAALRELVPGLDVTVIPNGIDTKKYAQSKVPPYISFPFHTRGSLLVFTGTMDFRPNVDAVLWFAQKALPAIQKKVPDVHFLVVGQRPHRRLDVLRDNPAVTLTGWVEDTRPYIALANVYIAPLRMGGGTRLKLLEAMALNKPVVSTSLGAEGYPITDGQELLLADTPTDFADTVVELLQSPELRKKLEHTGRVFVEQHYDWRKIVPQVEAVYEGMIKNRNQVF